MKLFKLVLALAVVAAPCVGSAITYNLGDLIDNNQSITVGDKIFDDFDFTAIGPLTADQVNVTPTQGVDPSHPELGVLYGLTFQGAFSSGVGGDTDYGLFYSVRTDDGSARISDIHQAYNLTATGNGGTVAIGETVWDAGFGFGNVVAQSSLGPMDFIDPDPELVQGDDLFIDPPLNKIYITKDLHFTANDEESSVEATHVFQRISQTQVPDGGSALILLGTTFSCLAWFNRRRETA